jgi:uncharacterized membrane protein YoaK (UPF0700 family)
VTANPSAAVSAAQPESAEAAVRRRQWLLVLLAVNSGAIDAVGYTMLGGSFTSVMTGNMILLGVSVGEAERALALRAALALVCFIAGVALGARIARSPRQGDPVWPAPVALAARVELGLIAVFSIGWWAAGGHPAGSAQPLLLGVGALALGLQSSAVLRFGVPGLSTTYMTGTLTTLVSALANGRHPRNVLPSMQILAGILLGALAATLLARHAPVWIPALELLPVGCAVAVPRDR